MTALSRSKFYPLMDGPPDLRSRYRARWTGEHRAPRRGEWYLSGAVVEAYMAFTDIPQSYPIAELVEGVTEWRPL